MPPYLIRTFKSKEHYEAFLKGKFIMRPLRYFRDIEDQVRRDDLEGKAKILSQGNVCHLGECGDMTFILCTSSPEAEAAQTEKFGMFRAKLCKPEALIDALNKYLKTHYPNKYACDARVLEVQYLKDEGTYPDHTESTLQQDIDAIVSLKPARFADDKEYRIVCSFHTGTMDGLDALEVKLGEVEGIVEPFA
jgi:hypothetical protein